MLVQTRNAAENRPFRWIPILAVAVACFVGFFASYAYAANILCSAGSVCNGTNGDDNMTGSGGVDYIYGHYGRDNIDGKGGGDWLWGNEDADEIFGANGEDTVVGMEGNDRATLNAGLYGNDGDDFITGGVGIDTLYGNGGNDALDAGPHNDALHAQDGVYDYLEGGGGFNNCTFDRGIDEVYHCN